MNWGLQFGQVVVRCLHKSMRQDCFSCLWQKLSLLLSLFLSLSCQKDRRGEGDSRTGGGLKEGGWHRQKEKQLISWMERDEQEEKHHFKEYYVWSQEFDAALERLSSVCACFSLTRALSLPLLRLSLAQPSKDGIRIVAATPPTGVRQ